VDHGADCIVGGEQADVVGPDHDQIGLLARCEGADTVTTRRSLASAGCTLC
jgi:hypothetical protein